MTIFLFIFAGYLIGSIPFALLVGKIGYQTDVREHGSGNLGATNTFRILGKKAGIIVLTGDLLKGTLATGLPLIFASSVNPLWVGLAAVIGHCYPIFARFKGGKAVATSGGILLCVDPMLFVTTILVFLLFIILFKMVSLSSIIATFYATTYAYFFSETSIAIVVALLTVMIIYRHRENIKRIMKKEEPKVYLFTRKKEK